MLLQDYGRRLPPMEDELLEPGDPGADGLADTRERGQLAVIDISHAGDGGPVAHSLSMID